MEQTIGQFNVRNYTDKSVLVTGNTKPFAEYFKGMGGKFNYFQLDKSSENRTPGWVFPITKREEVIRSVEKLVAAATSPPAQLDQYQDNLTIYYAKSLMGAMLEAQLKIHNENDITYIYGPRQDVATVIENDRLSIGNRTVFRVETPTHLLIAFTK